MRKERDLRTPESQQGYDRYKAENRSGCPFCFNDGLERKVFKKYKFWFVTENVFPYDKVYSVNHMLVPFRHMEQVWELTEEEKAEYLEIRKELAEKREFDELLENLPTTRTQIHYHMHLLAY